MARLPRYVIPGQPQHIIQRGNNKQVIFVAKEDYEYFRDVLVLAAQEYDLAIHAYVWMINHVHLLATPGQVGSISKVFQSAGRRYVRYFNDKYGRSGTLWEGRYRATVVDTEQYLLTLMRYIELNPVRAGMVALPGSYPWSSYAFNAWGGTGVNTQWLKPHMQYMRLGRCDQSRRAAYRALFHEALSGQDLQVIRELTHKGWAIGSDRFKQQIMALTSRQTESKGLGRPKKYGV
ncbi:transposase [Castellaniella sp.]|uniref:transposase n=1 Tax=Castellaniella sp. TaxID=1955812 RepID=UPI002AFFB435|nr:transposase [Castellaniella sp.]